jgi:FMN-dependent oxidoreductase (nitrilotriacetate monooxygenase family)
VVTTGADVSAHFSLRAHPDHADRYDRAEEFVEIVKGLWDSYEDDALIRDKESGVYVDPAKVHELGHRGKYYQVRGPLNVARPPQGHPVIIQAGASEPGRELAARTAEGVFTANQTLQDAQEFYADIRSRLPKYGRSQDELLVLPGIFPVIGGTEAEANQKYEFLQSLIHPAVAWNILKGQYQGVDLSGYSLDDVAPPLPSDTNLNKSRLKLVTDLVGTPEQIADAIQEWFDNGAADGFNIMPPILPTGLTDFIDQVVPILQRRGLFRTEYEGSTLRENLGLRRPVNRFTLPQTDRAATA